MDSLRTQRHKQEAPWKQLVEDEQTLTSQRSLATPTGPSDAFLNSLTPFQAKFHDLEALKKEALNVMARFHNLQLTYTDWFKRQLRTFVELMKSVQISQRHLAPEKITKLVHFRQLHQIALNIAANSKMAPQFDKFDQFNAFWRQFGELMGELERDVMAPLAAFCGSVGRLRQPEVKQQIDYLYGNLREAFSEHFDFSQCHNEKDHLFTYSLMTSDTDFLGLVGFIPYLIGFATKVCYLTTNIHLEKLK